MFCFKDSFDIWEICRRQCCDTSYQISDLSFKQNMLFFAGFGHYTVASSEDFQLSSKLISKFQLSKSDDITRVATSAQGSADFAL